jgi:hypothetical protein
MNVDVEAPRGDNYSHRTCYNAFDTHTKASVRSKTPPHPCAATRTVSLKWIKTKHILTSQVLQYPSNYLNTSAELGCSHLHGVNACSPAQILTVPSSIKDLMGVV